MATNKNLAQLVINRVENQEVYNYMVANGLIKDDELYLIGGDDNGGSDTTTAVLYTFQELTEEQKIQARANIGAVATDDIKIVTTTANGLMSANDKTKLDSVATGATKTSIAFKRWTSADMA